MKQALHNDSYKKIWKEKTDMRNLLFDSEKEIGFSIFTKRQF